MFQEFLDVTNQVAGGGDLWMTHAQSHQLYPDTVPSCSENNWFSLLFEYIFTNIGHF